MLKIIRFPLILCVLLALFSCGKDTDTGQIEISFYSKQLQPYFTDYIEDIIAEFEAQHPDVRINWIDVAEAAYIPRLMMMIRNNNTPDIINTNVELAPLLLAQNHIQSLTPYLSEETIGLYFPNVIETSSTFDEILHSVPWYLANSIALFNKDMMDMAGITEEEYPATWEEIYALAPAFHKATGKFLIAPNMGEPVALLHVFMAEGIPIINDGGDFVFYTPEAVELFEVLVDLYQQKVIPAQTLIITYRDITNMFQLEQIALYTSGTQFIREFRANTPALLDKVILRGSIRGKSNLVQTTASLLSLSSTSKHPELACEFMTFLTNSENQLEFCRRALILPSIKEAVRDDFFQKDDGTLESKARIIAAQQLPDGSAMNIETYFLDLIKDYLHEALHSAFTGQKTPDEALRTAQEKCRQMLESRQ